MISKPLSFFSAIPALASRLSSRSLQNRSRLAVLGTVLIALLFGAGSIAPAQAVSENFGTVNVGTTSAPVSLVFTFATADTLATTSVLTQGATGLDFADAGSDTCTANTAYLAGQTCTMNVTFTPRFAGTRIGAVVLEDTSGNAIATGRLQGTGVGPQVNFLPGTQSVIANAANNGLFEPEGVAVDGNGNIYIADLYNNRVLKEMLSAGSYTQSVIANAATNGLWAPWGVAVDGGGNVYIADYGNNRVLKETLSAGSYTQSVVANVLYSPAGVAVDGSGNLYIAASGSNRVLKETLSASGYTQSIISSSGLNEPEGIAVDGSGNVYVANYGNNQVMKETPTGGSYTQTVVGNGLREPAGLAVDGSGNLYIADGGNTRVLKETLSAGRYTQTVISSNGLNYPSGIAVDNSGNVYIADYSNNQVLKEDFVDPPSLIFTSTAVGSTSAESPETVTLENVGNAALSFPIPSTGNNPSISTNFILNSSGSSDCPLLSNESSEPATLAAGTSCQLPISFVPTAPGGVTGSLVLTDNNLNASAPGYASQSIALNNAGFTLGTSLTSMTIPPGASGTSTITVIGQNGFAGSVSLTVSGLPSGVTATVSPNPTTGSSVLTLTANSAASLASSVPITIAGTSGSLTETVALLLTVSPGPSFTLSVSPSSQSVNQGTSVTSTITVTGQNGFSGSVTLAALNLPSGVTASFAPNPTTGMSVLTLSASSAAPTGNYYVSISGASGVQSASAPKILLSVIPPPSLSVSPGSLTLVPGTPSEAAITVNTTTNVYLTASGIPSGVTASFTANPISSSGRSILELTANGPVAPGAYNVIITGTAGTQTATSTVALIVSPPTFSLYSSVGTTWITQGGSTNSTIILIPQAGFAGSVALASSGSPGISGSFSPNPTTGTSVLTLTADQTAPLGQGSVAITGTSGTFTATTYIYLTIFPAPGFSPSSENFGPVNIGTPSPSQTLTYTFGNDVILGSTAVLTQGEAGLDFADAGADSCTPHTGYALGQSCTMNVVFTPKFGGTRYGAVVLNDNNGNVIATAYLQGSGVGPQLNFLPGTESTVASASNGLSLPYGVAVDGSGNVYFADFFNNRILKETLSSGSYTQSTIPTSSLNSPESVAVDGSGNVYIADTNNSQILRESPSAGGYTESVVASGSTVGFNYPSAVAVDGNGNVYFTTQGTGTLFEMALSAGSYTSSTIPVAGASNPVGIAVDGSGNVYIADSGNDQIFKETPSAGGYIQSVVSTTGLTSPYGLAVDGSGNVYIADIAGNQVVKETLSGGSYIQSTISTSQLNFPSAVAVDGGGNVYIADNSNSRVLKEDFADAPSLTFASTAVGSTSADSPQTVTVENVGNAALSISAVSYPAAFPESRSETNDCAASTTLSANQTCTLTIDFSPSTAGASSGSIVLTDNNLNTPAPGAVQSISLSGTGTQATPTITWTAPTAITYGTPLSTTQLNASSTIAGNFTYSPAAGTVLTAGTQTLTATFTPTDTTDYTTVTAIVTLTVSQASSSIVWATPAAITYGTPLRASQLNASSTVAGTFTYSPAARTLLTAGTQTLTATFTPTDTTDYTTVTATVTLTVNKATPTIAWAAPAAITYGTPLTASQLNAASTTAGTFAYSPAAGTILNAGAQTLTAAFTPTDTTDYATATRSVSLTVNKAALVVAWATPAAIPYGTALSATQLDATSNAAGTYSYSPAAGTVLAVGNHTLSVTFTPSTPSNFTTTTATRTVTLTVNKATPTITWATPAAISYGTKLSGTQLDASASVAGSFVYSPASGTVLAVGNNTLKVTFTPSNTTDYVTATASVTLTVDKAIPVITWAKPSVITYGTALSATQLNASSAVAGTFKYAPASGTVLGAGTQTLSVTFTPTNTTDYTTATASVTLTVNKATPAITWATPKPITHGTPLSATQLDATSKVAGKFTYSPAAGTVLAVGNQKLSATFTPTDTTDYTAAAASVTLTVNK